MGAKTNELIAKHVHTRGFGLVYSCFEKGCPTKPYAAMPKGIMGNEVYGI